MIIPFLPYNEYGQKIVLLMYAKYTRSFNSETWKYKHWKYNDPNHVIPNYLPISSFFIDSQFSSVPNNASYTEKFQKGRNLSILAIRK